MTNFTRLAKYPTCNGIGTQDFDNSFFLVVDGARKYIQRTGTISCKHCMGKKEVLIQINGVEKVTSTKDE